tara:strand:+ start:88 stop:855 length:768 start_codon:yes stop_codon:yes gene_type:complete
VTNETGLSSKPWENYSSVLKGSDKPWTLEYAAKTTDTEVPLILEEEKETPEDPLVNQREHFLDTMEELEGTKRHEGAEGGKYADTHGYGLTERLRNELERKHKVKLDITKPRDMASKVWGILRKEVKSKHLPNLESMSIGEQTFVMSTYWNTKNIWGSAQALLKSKKFNPNLVPKYLENVRTGGRYLPGLGNRRVKDYNILAKAKGWPQIVKAAWSKSGGKFTFDSGPKDTVSFFLDKGNEMDTAKVPIVAFKTK